MNISLDASSQSEPSLEERAAVYDLLARLWQSEIDAPLKAALNQEPIASQWRQCGGVLPQETIEALAVDFCQLFIGPKDSIAPIQSVWSEGQLQGPSAAAMQRFLSLRLDDRWDATIPDHLGVQLALQGEFLRALADATPVQKIELESLIDVFFENHLTWPEPLFEAAIRKAQTEFYRGMVKLTRDFLQMERPRMPAPNETRPQ